MKRKITLPPMGMPLVLVVLASGQMLVVSLAIRDLRAEIAGIAMQLKRLSANPPQVPQQQDPSAN